MHITKEFFVNRFVTKYQKLGCSSVLTGPLSVVGNARSAFSFVHSPQEYALCVLNREVFVVQKSNPISKTP
jgi:hypothetical protein